MDIKLIASDLDGTLLNDQHQISEYTLQAWKAVQEKGIHIMPVTGRTFHGMCSSLPFEICEYTINTNGVHIFHNNKGKESLLWDKSIPWDLAHQVLIYGSTHFPTVTLQCYVGETLYSTFNNEDNEEYFQRSGVSSVQISTWDEIQGNNIAKIMFLGGHNALLEVQQGLSTIPHVQSLFSLPFYLEVFNTDASKGHAVTFIMDRLNIDVSQVLGIGDSYNDLALLDTCGHSYVMCNADAKVAPHLPRTEYSNNEHGVAKLLETLVL